MNHTNPSTEINQITETMNRLHLLSNIVVSDSTSYPRMYRSPMTLAPIQPSDDYSLDSQTKKNLKIIHCKRHRIIYHPYGF
jgi:hypothetical protein